MASSYTRGVPDDRGPAIEPFFRSNTRAYRIACWALVGIPLLFVVIGFLVPKEPAHVTGRSLNDVRFGEPSARPAP
jgi:hypothetical protein